MIRISVSASNGGYEVLVGSGARHELVRLIPRGAARAAIVTQERVGVDVQTGVASRTFLMADGERGKSLAAVELLCRGFAAWGLTRADVVVAVGGGVVTDTAGFAAAIYHRGVPVLHVPTTLLGQLDAAIGGKTGVNLPEGKNLVGAYWQPRAVVCDLDLLASLPRRELVSAFGEVARCELLSREDFGPLSLEEKIVRCVRMKAAAVAADEQETRQRRTLLNYGHTLAHALETCAGYELRHGEAVAIGLVFAALLAHGLGRIDRARVEEHRATVIGYGLPAALPAGLDPDQLLALMRRDKKAGAGLTFVLDGPSGVELVPDVPEHAVRRALELIAAP